MYSSIFCNSKRMGYRLSGPSAFFWGGLAPRAPPLLPVAGLPRTAALPAGPGRTSAWNLWKPWSVEASYGPTLYLKLQAFSNLFIQFLGNLKIGVCTGLAFQLQRALILQDAHGCLRGVQKQLPNIIQILPLPYRPDHSYPHFLSCWVTLATGNLRFYVIFRASGCLIPVQHGLEVWPWHLCFLHRVLRIVLQAAALAARSWGDLFGQESASDVCAKRPPVILKHGCRMWKLELLSCWRMLTFWVITNRPPITIRSLVAKDESVHKNVLYPSHPRRKISEGCLIWRDDGIHHCTSFQYNKAILCKVYACHGAKKSERFALKALIQSPLAHIVDFSIPRCSMYGIFTYICFI